MNRWSCVLWAGVWLSAVALEARADDSAATKFPIFLAEGFGGGDYFMVKEVLETAGATVCDPPDDQVPHFAGSETRAAVLSIQIAACALSNRVTAVNLIAYSQGGEDARVVLEKHPELLASVTTVGSPHRGSSRIADLFILCGAKQQLGLPCSRDEQGAFDAFIALGPVGADPDAPNPPDELGVLQVQCQISSGTDAVALALCTALGFDVGPVFDLKYPRGLPITPCGSGAEYVLGPFLDKIYLFSWGGAQVLTDPGDPSDAVLQGTAAFLGAESDGLVERCSTHFGTVLRDDYPWNHLDLINSRAGLTGESDPTLVYLDHAKRLKTLGL